VSFIGHENQAINRWSAFVSSPIRNDFAANRRFRVATADTAPQEAAFVDAP
jgi:hypothetical protein